MVNSIRSLHVGTEGLISVWDCCIDGVTVAGKKVMYQVEMNDPPKCA